MRFMNQFLFVLCIVVVVQSIDIRTSSFEEIYSGPGGTVSSNYKNANTAITYSKYESTVNFVILGTSLPEYYYEPIAEAFGPPTLKVVKGEDIVDPVLYGAAASGYFFDATNIYWLEIPELGVYFNCQKDGLAQLEISILTSLIDGTKTRNETITFYLQKTCYYTGYREGFSIGKGDEKNDDVVRHGVVQTGWSLESYEFFGQDPVVIPESEHVSIFRISISNPDYGNQYYDPPSVLVEDRDIVDLQVRGSADKGGVATSVPETLFFFYTCKSEGETNVIVIINLGFYGHIEFGFIKECAMNGGDEFHSDPAGVINVGVSKSEYSNIVENSRTAHEWQAEYPLTEVGTDDLLSIFYVSTLSGREQPFLSPVVSVYPNNAFKVTLSGSARDGGVATGSPQRFVVNYICEKVSEGHVIVTIKLPGYDTVEFGYKKQCVKLIRHQDHIYTANQILIGLLAFIGLAILVGIYVLKKRKSELEGQNRKSFKV